MGLAVPDGRRGSTTLVTQRWIEHRDAAVLVGNTFDRQGVAWLERDRHVTEGDRMLEFLRSRCRRSVRGMIWLAVPPVTIVPTRMGRLARASTKSRNSSDAICSSRHPPSSALRNAG